MSDTDFIRKSLFMLGGLLIWALQFAFLYGFNTLACARRLWTAQAFGMEIVPFVVAVATVGAFTCVLAVLLRAWRRAPAQDGREEKPVDAFIRYMAAAIASLSLVAILWTGLPAFLVTPCG